MVSSMVLTNGRVFLMTFRNTFSVKMKRILLQGPKNDTCTNIQRSAKVLQLSVVLLDASSNITLPGDCTSREGEILC